MKSWIKVGLGVMLLGADLQAAPPDYKLWMPQRMAQRAGWEWAAIGEMAMLQVTGNSPPQCAMIEQVLNAPAGTCCKIPPQQACSRPGHFPQLDALWQHQGRVALPLDELPSAEQLYAFLRMEQVLVVELSQPQQLTRLVTLKAMQFRGEAALLTLQDPAQAQAVELSYAVFARNWLRGMLLQ